MTLLIAHKGIRDSSIGTAVHVCVREKASMEAQKKMRAGKHLHVL